MSFFSLFFTGVIVGAAHESDFFVGCCRRCFSFSIHMKLSMQIINILGVSACVLCVCMVNSVEILQNFV